MNPELPNLWAHKMKQLAELASAGADVQQAIQDLLEAERQSILNRNPGSNMVKPMHHTRRHLTMLSTG